jgi:hypothetical protein
MAQVPLHFADFLTPTGLAQLKVKLDQVLANPADTAKLTFEQFLDEQQQQALELAVSIASQGGQYIIENTELPLTPVPYWVQNVASVLTKLRIVLNQTATAITDFVVEAESELQNLRKEAQDELAKIPYRIQIQNGSNGPEFHIVQTGPVNARIAQTLLTVTSSSLTFDASQISQLALNAQLTFQSFLQANGQPYVANVALSYAGNQLQVSGSNFPPGKIVGLPFTLQSFNLILQNNQFMQGSSAQGRLTFPMLDAGAQGPAAIDLQIDYQNNGDVIFQAATPEGQELKKNAISIFFRQIRIADRRQGSTDVDINGWLQLAGVTDPQTGGPVQTDFTFGYLQPHFTFTGTNFAPLPIAFGQLTFQTILLKIHENGTVVQNNFTGQWVLPAFNSGPIDFEVNYQFDQDKTLDITAVNPQNTPLNMGGLGLTLSALSLRYQNSTLQNASGNGTVVIPHITDGDAIQTQFRFARINQNEELFIEAANINGKRFAGAELDLDLVQFKFVNGSLDTSQITGKLQLPDVTDGAKLEVELAVSNGGNDYLLSLAGSTTDKVLNFGPVQLTFNQFSAQSVGGNLQHISGDGMLLLPALSQPFAFSFTANPSQNPVSYLITATDVQAELNGLSIHIASLNLQSNSSQPFLFSANGSLRLPLFASGSALGFILEVERNSTYRIAATSSQANDLLIFGDVKLGGVNLNLTINAGSVTTFNGSGQLTLPGFELPVGISINYNGLQDRYDINLQNPVQLSVAGNAINLTQFGLVITQGAFTSATGQGNFSLPDSTGGAGIDFNLSILNNGSDADLSLAGQAAARTIKFGEASLEFGAFNLSIRGGEVQQVSGSGDLSLPGLSQPMSFALSADFTNPQPRYRIFVENLGADLGSFNLQFNQIEIISVPGVNFSATANGSLTLSALSGNPLNFNLGIQRGNNYNVNINGNGQALSYGSVSIHDLALALNVQNGTVQQANGSAQVAIAGLSQADERIAVSVSYSSVPERFQLSINQVFPLALGPLTLSLNTLSFSLLNGAFEAGALSGNADLPVFGGSTALGFSLTLSQGGQSFTGSVQSTGVLASGGLSLRNIHLNAAVNNGTLQSLSGSAEVQTSLSAQWTLLQVQYSVNKLSFLAQNLPAITLGGLVFQFDQFGFSLQGGQLTDGNLSGSVTLPGFEANKNQFNFSYSLSQSNNHSFSVSYPAISPLHLKKGDVDLYLRTLSLSTTGASIQSASGDLDFSIQGLNRRSNQDEAARITVSASYSSANDNFRFALSNAPQLSIGGFDFTLNQLEVNLGSGGLQYPFVFSGDIVIPGLQDAQGQNANLAVAINVQAEDIFNGSITTNPAPQFNFGSVKLTLNSLAVSKNQQRFEVTIIGVLELTAFTAMGGDEATFSVNVSIDNQGNFSILGEVPNGNSVKVADVPSVVRLYLSKIGLSRNNNNWDFTLAGLIQNQIVLPGMEDLLPSEINLKDLALGSNFDLDMDLRWPTGFSVSIGGAATEAIIPVNGRFGEAVSLEAIKLSFTPLPNNGGGTLAMSLSGASLTLGPVAATVEGLGVEATITRAALNAQGAPTGQANFGVVHVAFDFKPPEGLGVALNTSIFTGGGYLYYNQDKGEYAGALELSFMNLFAISAVGLINNKMPDGKPGTSVLFIISVEFQPGIALGFGFFLSGLGGILGVHRTIQVERLRDGVRSGNIQNVLFPKNIIANISRIISDIKSFFPILRNQFVVGPMAAITWGVPTIIRIDLGLAVEIGRPTKFAILGVLRVLLPDEAVALIRLQVAFLGVLDLEKKMLSFDASLFDSKVLTFGMEGDMALRLGWGSKPDFVLSMGGFHPSYKPPTHLNIPNLKRLSLKILSGNPRLTLSNYFAVTSNTVQFGAGIDFYFGVAGFKVVGEFGYDVLFQFSPFRFVADARARLAVKAGGTTLLGITLTFTLEGPTPWRAKGTAKFKVLFFTVKVRFDETWGEKRDTSLPDIAVLPLLREALIDNQNWRSIPGSRPVAGMRMRAVADSSELILTPNGRIELSQKIVPLGVEISKFGQFNPADYTKFEITEATLGSNTAQLEALMDDFAPANFTAVSDSDKLALPSFEEQQAGVKITAQDGMKCGSVIDREVYYETFIMDNTVEESSNIRFAAMETTFFSLRGAVGQSRLSATRRNIVNPAKVTLKKPVYAVVDNDDFAVMGSAQNLTYMQAQEALAQNRSTAGAQIVTTELI